MPALRDSGGIDLRLELWGKAWLNKGDMSTIYEEITEGMKNAMRAKDTAGTPLSAKGVESLE